MTARNQTIDLGEVSWDTAPEPTETAWRRWGRHVSPRSGTRLLSIVIALALTVTTLTAAAAPARSPLELRFTLTASGFVVHTDHLYAVEHDPAGEALVTSYRLGDGEVVWQTPLVGEFDAVFPHSVDDGDLLLMAYPKPPEQLPEELPEDLPDARPGAVITNLDPATGALQWTTTGNLHGTVGDLLLLAGPVTDEAAPAAGHQVTAIDISSGQERWSTPVRGWGYLEPTGDGRLVAIGPGGQLTTYDVATGAELATSGVLMAPPETVSLIGADEYFHQRVVGSTVVVGGSSYGQPYPLSGFDVESLQLRWRNQSSYDWVHPCDEWLCLMSSSGLVALDPATGRQVWSADWLSTARTSTQGLQYLREPVSGYHLVADGYDSPARHWLVDLATGELALELGRWRPIVSAQPLPEGPTWVIAAPRPGQLEAPARAGWLRPDLSGVDLVGPLHQTGNCEGWHPYLICQLWDRGGHQVELEVWRLR